MQERERKRQRDDLRDPVPLHGCKRSSFCGQVCVSQAHELNPSSVIDVGSSRAAKEGRKSSKPSKNAFYESGLKDVAADNATNRY